MILFLESFDLAELGLIRSLLEANGIRTHMKNEFLSGALGDLPFQEVAPQLYLLNPRDLTAAKALLDTEQPRT